MIKVFILYVQNILVYYSMYTVIITLRNIIDTCQLLPCSRLDEVNFMCV